MQTVTDGTELQDFRLTVGVCTYLAIFACITILGMNPAILLCYKDVSDPRLTSFLVSHWENITERRDTCRVCGGGPAAVGLVLLLQVKGRGGRSGFSGANRGRAGGRKPRLLPHGFDNFPWTAWHLRWHFLCPDQARRGAGRQEGGKLPEALIAAVPSEGKGLDPLQHRNIAHTKSFCFIYF